MLDLPEFREQGNAQRGGLEMTCVQGLLFWYRIPLSGNWLDGGYPSARPDSRERFPAHANLRGG